MAKKPAARKEHAANIREHAVEAHDEFITRVKQAIARVKRLAEDENTSASHDWKDRRASNMATIKGCEESGIVEAMRRYGGINTGILRVSDDGLAQFLAGVRAKLELNIRERSDRVAKLSLELYRHNPDSGKTSEARASHIVTVGYLEGYKRVLALFDACFGALQAQVAVKS